MVHVDYGLNEASLLGLSAVGTNKYQVVLTLDADRSTPGNQGLTSGNYAVIVKHYVASSSTSAGQAGVCDARHNPLNVTGFTPNGADFSMTSRSSRWCCRSIAMIRTHTTATSVQFDVTFSESVTGVAVGDFVLATTGTVAGTIASVSGSGSTYTVTVNGVSGNGHSRIELGRR